MTEIKIVADCATGEVVEVPLTSAEIAQRQADIVASLAAQTTEQTANAALAAKQAALESKLAKLGLTLDDLKGALS